MTVILLAFCLFQLIVAIPNDQTQIEKYNDKIRTYQLEVPGKDPITIIETAPIDIQQHKWGEPSTGEKDEVEMKNLMTHIVHDVNGNRPRCYGPSCQEGFDESVGPQEDIEDFVTENADKLKGIRDFSKDRLEAITALAAKLKKDKLNGDRFSSFNNEEEEEDNGKVYTYWNRLKVKQHKHPYDDKEGWVTMEPVAWSTSKISKWKPNVKKQKPNHWNDNDDNRFSNDDRYTSYQGMENSYTYPQKKPSGINRPGFNNNKLHVSSDYDTELPSKPSWATNNNMNKFPPPSHSYHSSWSPDEGRRPHKPHCDSDENYPNEDTVYYGMSDSVITDPRPSNFPYEYEALHQSPSQKRPIRRPTQVIYAGNDYDDDRSSRPPYGDGQWVLLSTTKGYRNKKRQRSLNPPEDPLDFPTVTSHQAVALTVLPVDDSHTNMTTSHGGMLEVERSFQTVEESKRDMDKKNDLEVSASENRPVKKKVVRRIVPHKNTPDSSTVLAAVGAGMLPATMAMVVPMMLGRRRRRRDTHEMSNIDHLLYRYE
ncbi:uncharacterized protein [Epargyreus clarus]|uniref:uncharacterized protein n=1 Tax=Epargyreus clarus TaxID=520877 RepID=UPI003C30AE0E